jgi:hypothetical protein
MQWSGYDRPQASSFVVGTLQGYDRRHSQSMPMLQVQSKGHFKASTNNDVDTTIADIISQVVAVDVVLLLSLASMTIKLKKGALLHSRRVDDLVVVRGAVQLAMHHIAAVRSGKKGLEPTTDQGTIE